MKWLAAPICLLFLTQVAFAQSPYGGMQMRPIKALSDHMGLALPAELNDYPGPAHVLELADKLELSSDQRARVQSLFDAMKAEAVPLGARLLDQEAALDQQFASHSITPETLKAATAQIGVTQAELRNTHLKYHLQTTQILTHDQMQRYAVLRGYGSSVPMHQHHMQ